MFTVVGLLAAPLLPSTAPERELTLQQVLKANTAAAQAIRALHVTIDVSNNFQLPGEEKPPLEAQPTYRTEWYKDGDRERVRMNWLRGRRPHNYDAYNGPRGYKRLNNYDPNFKPPLSESISYPATGDINKTQTDGALSHSARGISFMMPLGSTLEEYVAKHPSSKLAATPATSKLGCYEITLVEERSPVAGSSFQGDDVRDLRIFVDPKAGFWIRRIERGPWQKSTDSGDKGTNIAVVQEFKNCGNGIFWPLRAYQRTRLPGGTIGPDVFVRLTLHSINQPLPEEDFEIHFPDWLRVYDHPSGQVIIWGPDDKPRMTFASTGEYNEWYTPRMQDPFQETKGVPQRTRLAWLVGISVVVGLLLLLIIRRNRIARVAGGMSQSAEKTQGDASVTS